MDDKVDSSSSSSAAPPSIFYKGNKSPIWNAFDKFKSIFSNRTTAIVAVLVLVLGLGAGIIAVQRSTEYRQQAATSFQEITKDSASGAKTAATRIATSIIWSHTIGTGDNRLLVVSATTKYDPNTINNLNAKYGNTIMSGYNTVDNRAKGISMYTWYLVNPPTGQNTVTITSTNQSSMVGVASSWFGVLQSHPVDVARTKSGDITTTPFVLFVNSFDGVNKSTTYDSGDAIIDIFSTTAGIDGCDIDVTPATNQQLLTKQKNTIVAAATSRKTSPSTPLEMGWYAISCNHSDNPGYLYTMMAINPAPATSSTIAPTRTPTPTVTPTADLSVTLYAKKSTDTVWTSTELSGQKPLLYNLRATVTGTATGNIRYRFMCWKKDSGVWLGDTTISSTSHTFGDTCQHLSDVSTIYAQVEVTRQGIVRLDEIPITALSTNTPTNTPTPTITIAPGSFNSADINRDGAVTLADFNLWKRAFLGQDSEPYQFTDSGGHLKPYFPNVNNQDGVTLADFNLWKIEFLK